MLRVCVYNIIRINMHIYLHSISIAKTNYPPLFSNIGFIAALFAFILVSQNLIKI